MFRSDPGRQSLAFWGAWHAAVVGSLGLLGVLTLGLPIAVSAALAQVAALILGYLILSLYVVPAALRSPPVLLAHLIVGAVLLYGGAYALLDRLQWPVSPWILGLGGFFTMVGAIVPYLAVKPRIAAVGGLVIALAVTAVAQKPDRPSDVQAPRPLGTALYPLSVQTYRTLIEPPAADGGAIDSAGSGMILATGAGEFYWLADVAGPGTLAATRLDFPAPADRAAYLADFDQPAKAPRLRLTDISFDREAVPKQLFAAHEYWNSGARCYTMRVSALTLGWSADGVPESTTPWRTVLETRPCMKADIPFDDSETGGRLAWARDGGLLLSLGDFGFAGLDGNPPYAQDDAVDYGKILKIDPISGVASVVSKGHRNPQGLTVDRLGRIWSSEHGPQGGDEVNLIVQGANYGWPEVTYGTSYGSKTWPLNPEGRDHGKFQEPAIAFLPAIATSAMMELRGEEFPRWDGDLLLATLRTQSVFRLRLRDDRIIYAEPILIGERIRDLTQTADGRIFLWSDAGIIIELARSTRDEAFSSACAGCHAPTYGMSAAPTLAGVIGRDIASVPGFTYSAALSSVAGAWTEQSLAAFLRNPNGFAPGTLMNIDGLDDKIVGEVIAYLKTPAE